MSGLEEGGGREKRAGRERTGRGAGRERRGRGEREEGGEREKSCSERFVERESGSEIPCV